MRTLLCIAILTTLVSASFAEEPVPPGGNKMCPVMVDQPARGDRVATYQGKKIFFCCDKCLAKFNATPTKYLANIEGFAAPTPTDSEPKAKPAPTRRPLGEALKELFGKLHIVFVHFPLAL